MHSSELARLRVSVRILSGITNVSDYFLPRHDLRRDTGCFLRKRFIASASSEALSQSGFPFAN
jgi:hypothetical protein